MSDKREPNPGKQDLQRAAEAVKIAAGMVAYCCAVHDGEGVDGWPTLHLDDVAVPDVIDALTRMLADQIQAVETEAEVTIKVEVCDENAWELAGQVARNCGFDSGQFRGATLLGDKRAQFWAASQAHKPEDDPDWN